MSMDAIAIEKELRRVRQAFEACHKLQQKLEQAVGAIAGLKEFNGLQDSVLMVAEVTARELGRTYDSMFSPCRERHVIYARHLAMYVARKVLPRNSLAGIGRAFEQDHGTVLNAIQRVQDLIDTNDAQLKRDLAKVEAAVRAAMKDGRL